MGKRQRIGTYLFVLDLERRNSDSALINEFGPDLVDMDKVEKMSKEERVRLARLGEIRCDR